MYFLCECSKAINLNVLDLANVQRFAIKGIILNMAFLTVKGNLMVSEQNKNSTLHTNLKQGHYSTIQQIKLTG